MEYQVPQFIEVEDKIIGPLTFKQFIYLTGAAGLCVVFFSYLPFWLAALLSLPVVGLAVALSFYRVNNKPLIDMIEAGFNYYTAKKLLLWKQPVPGTTVTEERDAAPQVSEARAAPRISRGKLSELAWSLDVKKGESS